MCPYFHIANIFYSLAFFSVIFFLASPIIYMFSYDYMRENDYPLGYSAILCFVAFALNVVNTMLAYNLRGIWIKEQSSTVQSTPGGTIQNQNVVTPVGPPPYSTQVPSTGVQPYPVQVAPPQYSQMYDNGSPQVYTVQTEMYPPVAANMYSKA